MNIYNITLLRICAVYCLLFSALNIVYLILKSKGDISSIREKVRESNTAMLIHPRKYPTADDWQLADFNSWGVFAVTSEWTMVIFDLHGKPVAEVCFPCKFKNFKVDDDAVTLIGRDDRPSVFHFTDFVWFGTNFSFSVPPVSDQFRIESVECNENSLRIIYPQGHKSLHYLCVLPKRVITSITAVYYSVWLLCGLYILLNIIDILL